MRGKRAKKLRRQVLKDVSFRGVDFTRAYRQTKKAYVKDRRTNGC
jgi:hypothetical protein